MLACHWPRTDPRIRNVPCTTLCGERLSRHAIAEIQETVQFFPVLSRSELVRTVCGSGTARQSRSGDMPSSFG